MASGQCGDCDPSGLAVIDIDPRNGGEDSLAKLEKELGSLPRTMTVRTGGGGEHIYLSLPGGTDVRSGSLGSGVDSKSDGGYVIAAPSVHVSGRAYTSNRLELGNLFEAPANWLERIAMVGMGSKLDAETEQGTPKPLNTICCILPLHARSTVPVHAVPKPEKPNCEPRDQLEEYSGAGQRPGGPNQASDSLVVGGISSTHDSQ